MCALNPTTCGAGFSPAIARWVVTNLRSSNGSAGGRDLRWTFDLDGIADMYRSYEQTSLWPVLRSPPEGLKLDFVKVRAAWGLGGLRVLCAT